MSSNSSVAGISLVNYRDSNTSRLETNSQTRKYSKSSRQSRQLSQSPTIFEGNEAKNIAKTVLIEECMTANHLQPPVGTYNLPTTFDNNSYNHQASAAFKSNARVTDHFYENNTCYYKSNRLEIIDSNMGPGKYDLEFNWNKSNCKSHDSHFKPITSKDGSRSGSPTTRSCCSNRASPVGYEKSWLVEKTVVENLSPRELQVKKESIVSDIESVRGLPSY